MPKGAHHLHQEGIMSRKDKANDKKREAKALERRESHLRGEVKKVARKTKPNPFSAARYL